jgi:OOP family OmpA-OmpF porin
MDKCPNTPRGVAVDSSGCPIKIFKKGKKVSTELLVKFDFDKAVIKPEYHGHLSGVANFLKKHPDARVQLEGHTDRVGTEAYNHALSVQRAESVKAYLVEKFGIAGSRITTRGYGATQPIATNDTYEGRRRNRRVVANITTVAK